MPVIDGKPGLAKEELSLPPSVKKADEDVGKDIEKEPLDEAGWRSVDRRRLVHGFDPAERERLFPDIPWPGCELRPRHTRPKTFPSLRFSGGRRAIRRLIQGQL